jgi:hypothetical protein
MLVHVNGPKALRYPRPSAHGLAPHRAEVARAERRDGAWASVRRRAPPDALRGVATRARPKASPPRHRLPCAGHPKGLQLVILLPPVPLTTFRPPSAPSSLLLHMDVTRGRHTRLLHAAVTHDRYTQSLHTVVIRGRYTRRHTRALHAGVTRGRYTRTLHTVVTRGRYIR